MGGPDPASNAAGVALATYPSTQPSQQPQAVTLVDADDWRSAIAASVLMAAPLGAPVLISEADDVPEPTMQALDALDPQGGKKTKGIQAFAIGAASAPSDLRRSRWAVVARPARRRSPSCATNCSAEPRGTS